MSFLDPTRLLSVQSHVVSGYVGNRAATFPLQLLGYDVDVVNTVQFSNHTGYGHTNGHKTTAEQIDLVFQGLKTNGLCRWFRCLTGYIPGAEAVEAVGKEIRSLKTRAEEEGEQVLYLLDPVMGDIGKGLYVAQDVVPVYRSLLPLASIITPNQFEIELLSETKITSFSTLFQALQVLHREPYGVKHVVISSIPLPRRMVERMGLPGAPAGYSTLIQGGRSGGTDEVEDEGEDEDEVLVCFASTSTSNSDDGLNSTTSTSTIQTYAYALPTIRGYYSGVGDLFSALVLGCFKRGGTTTTATTGQTTTTTTKEETDAEELDNAVGLALWGVQVVLLKTHQGTLSGGGVAGHHQADDHHHHQHDPTTLNQPQQRRDADPTPSCIPSDEELDKATSTTTTDDPTSDGSRPTRSSPPPPGPSRRAKRMRLRELRIVGEKEVLGRLGQGQGRGEAGERWVGKKLDWDGLLGDEA